MMPRSAVLLPLLIGAASAFAPAAVPQSAAAASSSALFAGLDRRGALAKTGQLAVAGFSLSTFGLASPVQAEGTKKVVVAGATGQTGVSDWCLGGSPSIGLLFWAFGFHVLCI